MKQSAKILLAAIIPAAFIFFVALVFFFRWRRRGSNSVSTPINFGDSAQTSRKEKLESGLAKFHLSAHKSVAKHKLWFHNVQESHQHQPPAAAAAAIHQPPAFNWADHPQLTVEAVENGWSRFAFGGRTSSPPVRSTPTRWTLCIGGQPQEAEFNWELPPGASEFMQTVRLSPELHPAPKKSPNSNNLNSSSVPFSDDDPSCCSVRMCLPLPGPPLGNYSFPQEAYFEITILYLQPPQHRSHRASKRSRTGSIDEGDRAKLIQDKAMETQSNFINGNGVPDFTSPMLESKSLKPEESKHNNLLVSLGLTVDNNSLSMPGMSPGSIGFHSNGSVYLDGMKLIFESERSQWANESRVVGCGFDPIKQKVFFTIDSELVHIIRCSSDVYKNPLYPVLAATGEVMVMVNLGQSEFKYDPANAQRTANPSFLLRSSPETTVMNLGSVDSRELFSVGRSESEWFDIVAKNRNHSSSKKSAGNADESNADAESDLFEIALHN